MAWIRITENGKSTLLKVDDEKCAAGMALIEQWEETYGTHVTDGAWERAMALREKHKAEDKKGIYT